LTRFVLDASIALSWFVDQPVAAYAKQARQLLSQGGIAFVPAIWELEVLNGFVKAERRRKLSTAEVDNALHDLSGLRRATIQLDPALPSLAQILKYARAHQLTSYDASYLELAERVGLPLASLDTTLQVAAGKAGVQLI
jgi:predicted nucleic acid-binding protein